MEERRATIMTMAKVQNKIASLRYQAIRIWIDAIVLDRRGQDLIEYALLGGFVSVAAAVIFPTTVVPSISTVFNKVLSLLNQTATRMG